MVVARPVRAAAARCVRVLVVSVRAAVPGVAPVSAQPRHLPHDVPQLPQLAVYQGLQLATLEIFDKI